MNKDLEALECKNKNIKFKDLNDIARIMKNYSKEEREEIISSFDIDFETYYKNLQSKNWNITTNKGNIIFNLHKDGGKNGE